jgi:hypothetical protein
MAKEYYKELKGKRNFQTPEDVKSAIVSTCAIEYMVDL